MEFGHRSFEWGPSLVSGLVFDACLRAALPVLLWLQQMRERMPCFDATRSVMVFAPALALPDSVKALLRPGWPGFAEPFNDDCGQS